MFKPMTMTLFLLGAASLAFGAGATQPATKPATKPAGQAASKPATQALKELTLDLGNNVSMKFVLIPAGKFTMGSPKDEKGRNAIETQHEVRISKPFFMAVTPVTQGQWKAVMGKGPFEGKDYVQAKDENAASHISWNDAVAFCNAMGAKAHKLVRLPTEAEWEYACRAGTQTRYYWGDDPDLKEIGDYALYDQNAWNVGKAYPHAVGQKKPNAWGLYDMSGNVNQWCIDWLGPYAAGAVTDPTGPARPGKDQFRVFRGGSFVIDSTFLRCAARNRNTVDRRIIDNGCRMVVEGKG